MARFLADGEGVALATGQLLIAAAILAVITALVDGAPDTMTAEVILDMLGLGVLGTGLAYVLMYRLVRLAGPTTASTVTYLTPLVSTTLGVAILSESVSWHEPAGGTIVLVGVWLSTRR